ncbi:class I SAM-dependent methyltransferase [Kitasatospora atroaurantiaca]|uniref:class I SAM-dependent methyltransferase n=1 Tax=Kitasatospora atroaurantiaca TaxID=285545 RepID=UPI0011A485B1|nr:class I SAM-dependent methyltransferase [Kitasatospora atroaurantiaca]
MLLPQTDGGDQDDGRVRRARAAARAPKADVRLAVLPELPFADASFDAVVANFVVNHVEDPVAALAELRRVTRPGGRIAASIWSSASNGAMELFNRAIDAAGVERPVFPAVPVAFDRSPDGFAGLLARAGWSGAVGRELSWTHRAHPEDWWAGPAGGVANVGLVVAGQTAGAAAVIKQHYDRLAAGELAEDGRLAVPATAVLALARTEP